MNSSDHAALFTGFSGSLLPFPYLVTLVLIALTLAVVVGFHIGQVDRRYRGYDQIAPEKIPGGTSLGALLALLGLLLGFAFSSALGWREARQSALVNEAAAISTAFRTADLLENPGQTELQTRILTYAKTRLATPDDIQSLEAWNAFLSATLNAQAEIWPAARRAISNEPSDPTRVAIVRSVTNMLDAHTKRIAAAAEQIPPPAKLMVFLTAVVGVFNVGNRSALQGKALTWRAFVFAVVLSIVMIMILDLELALEGTIQMNPDTLLATIHEMETDLAKRTE
jgi:hypothetical protein